LNIAVWHTVFFNPFFIDVLVWNSWKSPPFYKVCSSSLNADLFSEYIIIDKEND